MEAQLSPVVSVIVVNYRTPEMTLDCLRSIARETKDLNYEILLVDNASNDGIMEVVGREMPAVRCLPLSTNVGFARALWDRLGGFDGIFFMYGEEADFCLRAATNGARPTFTPQARIIHYGGASQQVETEKLVRGLSARAELIQRHVPMASRRLGLF